jgi:hypothetical protein
MPWSPPSFLGEVRKEEEEEEEEEEQKEKKEKKKEKREEPPFSTARIHVSITPPHYAILRRSCFLFWWSTMHTCNFNFVDLPPLPTTKFVGSNSSTVLQSAVESLIEGSGPTTLTDSTLLQRRPVEFVGSGILLGAI